MRGGNWWRCKILPPGWGRPISSACAAFWGWNAAVQLLVDRGADLNAKDSRGMTPVDSALGKAGGNSRGGQRIDVHEDTAALLRKLMGN